MTRVLVTGSSGYVASDLVPRLKDEIYVFGVDQHFSNYSDLEASIESFEFKNCMDQCDEEEIIVVNLAAARFDSAPLALLGSVILFYMLYFFLQLPQVSYSTFRIRKFLESYYRDRHRIYSAGEGEAAIDKKYQN